MDTGISQEETYWNPKSRSDLKMILYHNIISLCPCRTVVDLDSEAIRRKMTTTIKHVRDVNNFIREAITKGTDLQDPAARDALIRSFLSDCLPAGCKTMTPELFLFFLQKLNAHALYESFDNASYTIVFPTYIPFDIAAVAETYGYPDIFKRVERNLMDRQAKVGTTKTAAMIFNDLGGVDYMDKVAGYNSTATDQKQFSRMRDLAEFDKRAEIRDLRSEVGRMYWTYSNLEDFTKLEAFRCNPHWAPLFDDIKSHTPIMGGKDKTATLRDYNRLTELLDKIDGLEHTGTGRKG